MVIDQFPRRAFLRGLVALGASGLVATPAIVRASSLDLPPIRHLLEAQDRDVAKALMHAKNYGAQPNDLARIKSELERYHFHPGVYDGTAYNQKTGLWEGGLSREMLAKRPELLTDSMPKSEWMKRRNAWVNGGATRYEPWVNSQERFGDCKHKFGQLRAKVDEATSYQPGLYAYGPNPTKPKS